jgi:Zn-dependent M28 family amino/carboxypeptidase
MPPPGISIQNLKAHVQALAGEIGERNVFRPKALRRAEEYIERVWRAQGYEVVRQEYVVGGEKWANLEVTRRRRGQPTAILLLGAHYDSVVGCPGANDNATGVAALLEIARSYTVVEPTMSIRFVAFVNEESPFFKTAQMGSRVYAQMARARGDQIGAMVSLETIGYYSDASGSQQFPFPSWLYDLAFPDRGNFIIFASNWGSRVVMRRVEALFRAHSDFPVESISTFEVVPGVDWSDHSSFWRVGYPAFMVTDTALYRYPHYHLPTDTPDKVNYEALARVTQGLAGAFRTFQG